MEAVASVSVKKQIGTIPCCECASPILPNITNLCNTCLSATTDLSKSLPRQVTLKQCTGCHRYFLRPQVWVVASPESRELLAVCLKQLKGLCDLQLVNAVFNQADPRDTKRMQVKLAVRLDTVEEVLLKTCALSVTTTRIRISGTVWFRFKEFKNHTFLILT